MRPLHGLRVDSRRGDHIELSVELHELGCPDELQAAQALIIINYLGDALCQGQPAPVGAPPGSGLTGTATADVIVGSAGNDAIRGVAAMTWSAPAPATTASLAAPATTASPPAPGKDNISGGAGDDSVSGGPGNDRLLERSSAAR